MKYLPRFSVFSIRLLTTAAIAALVVSLLATVYVFNTLNSPINTSNSSATFEVAGGSSLSQISRDLKALGLIKHPRLFVMWARMTGVENAIQQGEYKVEDGESPAQLLTKMVAGKTIQYRVTLVEGWTFQQALNAIQASEKIVPLLKDLSDQQIIAKSALPFQHVEGSLFPDTYFYTAGSSDIDILRRASDKLISVLQQEWDKRLGALPYESPYQALIMASIIEKESAASSERGHISGVFIRRLERGMRLQSDPTVIYGMGSSYFGNIRKSDLQAVTPYNTYRINGLPPTPIALAGFNSIRASLNPEPSEYLYFVAQGDGSHYFSSSLEEHNQAVARLLNREND